MMKRMEKRTKMTKRAAKLKAATRKAMNRNLKVVKKRAMRTKKRPMMKRMEKRTKMTKRAAKVMKRAAKVTKRAAKVTKREAKETRAATTTLTKSKQLKVTMMKRMDQRPSRR